MENREKLEIPTIEFTSVTLLELTSSTCAQPTDECPENTGTIAKGCKEQCEFKQ